MLHKIHRHVNSKCPLDNSRAYLERGGAYYHKGDLESALQDAKKSANLGSQEGRRRYEQLKKRLGRQ